MAQPRVGTTLQRREEGDHHQKGMLQRQCEETTRLYLEPLQVVLRKTQAATL